MGEPLMLSSNARGHIKTGCIIAGAILGAWLLSLPVRAQVGTCTCVSDPPVELSLTTGGGAGRYEPEGSFLGSLMQMLAGDVDTAANFVALYPGWQDPGANAAMKGAQIAAKTLSTEAAAISIAQGQANDFAAEGAQFAKLEACNVSSVSLLQAIQCGNEIALYGAQQTQMLRQLMVTQIIEESVAHGESLNERAQRGASNEVSQLTAAQQ